MPHKQAVAAGSRVTLRSAAGVQCGSGKSWVLSAVGHEATIPSAPIRARLQGGLLFFATVPPAHPVNKDSSCLSQL